MKKMQKIMLVMKIIIQQTKKNNTKSYTYPEIGKLEKEKNPGDFQELPKSERKNEGVKNERQRG